MMLTVWCATDEHYMYTYIYTILDASTLVILEHVSVILVVSL